MQEKACVGIIVPVYNVEAYLTRCLDSLLNQSYENFVIVLINDASTDCSREICLDYQLREKRIVFIDTLSNAGVAGTRNKALQILEQGDKSIEMLKEQMEGIEIHTQLSAIPNVEYVMFVDSDDYLSHDALQTITTDFRDYDVDIYIHNYHYVVDVRGEVGVHNYRIFPQVQEAKVYTPLELVRLNPKNIVTTTWAFVYKASFLFKHHFRFIDGISNEDVPFCTQAFITAQSVYVSFAKWYYYFLSPVSEMRGKMGAQKVKRFFHSWIVILDFFIACYESVCVKDRQGAAMGDCALLKKFYEANIVRCLKRIFELVYEYGYSDDFPKERLKPYIHWGGQNTTSFIAILDLRNFYNFPFRAIFPKFSEKTPYYLNIGGCYVCA